MIRALIFDLCDIVVRTAGLPGLAQWFCQSAEFVAFERGEIGAATFLAALRQGSAVAGFAN